MQTLINWTARRAGGRITIKGVDKASGQPVKVIGVDTIKSAVNAGTPVVIATCEAIAIDERPERNYLLA